MSQVSQECAALFAEAAPAILDVLRDGIRAQGGDLSIVQLRALGYVARHPEASLSDVSAVIGLTLPATSRMVDGLVERKLVARAAASDDRRKITLTATAAGRAAVRAARKAGQARLAELIEGFPADDLAAVARVLVALQTRLPGSAARAEVKA